MTSFPAALRCSASLGAACLLLLPGGVVAQERGGSTPAERGQPAPVETSVQSVLFLAGPVRNDADLARLKAALANVAGVREVSFRTADAANRARVSVQTDGPPRLELMLQAARNGGFTLEKLEERRENGPTRFLIAATPVRLDADALRLQTTLSRVEGARVTGVQVGDRPGSVVVTVLGTEKTQPQALLQAAGRAGYEARFLDGGTSGGGRPGGSIGRGGVGQLPQVPAARGSMLLLAGPIRNNEDLGRLREVLKKVEGVQDVVFRTADPANRARVEVRTTNSVRYEALLQAARNAGFTLEKVDK